jgi:hypothetical protein
MAKRSITDFQLVEELPEPISDCMGYASKSSPPGTVWTCGILARDTVMYSSGRIAHAGDPVCHDVDPKELARCRALAERALDLNVPGLSSEGHFDWAAFFVVANRDDPSPERINEVQVREMFGGTILPIAPIVIESIAGDGPWWDEWMTWARSESDNTARERKIDPEVWWERCWSAADALYKRGLSLRVGSKTDWTEEDAILRVLKDPGDNSRVGWVEVSTVENLLPMLKTIRFFRGPDFRDATLVKISDYFHKVQTPKATWPTGLQSWPTCMPRLLVGLTPAGSLAGLIGSVVET